MPDQLPGAPEGGCTTLSPLGLWLDTARHTGNNAGDVIGILSEGVSVPVQGRQMSCEPVTFAVSTTIFEGARHALGLTVARGAGDD